MSTFHFEPFVHHHNGENLVERVVPLLERSGTRTMFSGHEHHFQHPHRKGIDYFVTGAGGKLRGAEPDRLREADTRSFTYLRLQRPDGDPAEVPMVIER